MEVWIRESEKKELVLKVAEVVATGNVEEAVDAVLNEIGIGILEDEPVETIETEKEGVS